MVPFTSPLSAIALEQQSFITTQNIQSDYEVMTEINSIFEEILPKKVYMQFSSLIFI
jgi:hypothetical protein